MKNLIISAFVAMILAPLSLTSPAFANGKTAHEDGVSSGGTGGMPNAHPTGEGEGSEGEGSSTTSSVGTMSITSFGRGFLENRVTEEEEVIVNRKDLLQAVDAALNAEDLEMKIKGKTTRIRPQDFDLTNGILHGQNLETSRNIRLIDKTKAGLLRPGALDR